MAFLWGSSSWRVCRLWRLEHGGCGVTNFCAMKRIITELLASWFSESRQRVPIDIDTQSVLSLVSSQSIHRHDCGRPRRWSFDEGNKAYRHFKSGPYPFFKNGERSGPGSDATSDSDVIYVQRKDSFPLSRSWSRSQFRSRSRSNSFTSHSDKENSLSPSP